MVSDFTGFSTTQKSRLPFDGNVKRLQIHLPMLFLMVESEDKICLNMHEHAIQSWVVGRIIPSHPMCFLFKNSQWCAKKNTPPGYPCEGYGKYRLGPGEDGPVAWGTLAGGEKVGEKYFFLGDPWLAGGNSNIFYFHPHLGKFSNLTNIFHRGWNQTSWGFDGKIFPRKLMKVCDFFLAGCGLR